MCDIFDRYLASSGNRDKVMAIAQFLPLMLELPAKNAGCANLSKSLGNLSKMADSYRAITRLTLLFGALSKSKLHALAHHKGDRLVAHADQISHAFHVFYCIFENTAVLSSHGVFDSRLTRLGGCAVTCWFYVLLVGVARELYVLSTTNLTEEQKKGHMITLLKLSCFLVFSTTCVPKDGPQLLEIASGPLAPIHHLLRAIAPAHVELNDTIRGALGLVASICDFH